MKNKRWTIIGHSSIYGSTIDHVKAPTAESARLAVKRARSGQGTICVLVTLPGFIPLGEIELDFSNISFCE